MKIDTHENKLIHSIAKKSLFTGQAIDLKIMKGIAIV